MKIIISGLTAAGKTTHSKLIASKYQFVYISGSILLNDNMGVPERKSLDYWLTDESFALDSVRMANPEKDKIVDHKLQEILEKSTGDYIFDAWALPWYSTTPALRIWLESSLESRAKKAVVSYNGTSKFTQEDCAQRLPIRDKHNRDYFLQTYGFDIVNNRDPFDIIMDISDFITDANAAASQKSINAADEILCRILDWYRDPKSGLVPFRNTYLKHPPSVFVRLPNDLLSEMQIAVKRS